MKIAITKVEMGETRVYDDPTFSEFWWEEGNGGCDCNRELCFEYAGSPEEDESQIFLRIGDTLQCGDGRFTIEFKNA